MIPAITNKIGNVDNDCSYGGVVKIWAIERDNAELTFDATNDTVITAITATNAAKAVEIVIRPDTGDGNGEFTRDGSDLYYKQTLNFTIAGNDAITAFAQKQLDLNRYLFVALRETGELIVFGGGSAGMKSVKSTAGAKSGANGRVFNFEGKAKAPEHSITQAILTGLL